MTKVEPLEKQQNKQHFESLKHLRDELGKQTQNQERLEKFQKTIDEEIKKGEEKGIIEFTEEEWKSLITNENLPPIAQLQELLKQKIKTRKEVVDVAISDKKGLRGAVENGIKSVKEKGESLIEKGKEFALGTKEGVEKMIIDNKERIKKFGKFAPWGLGLLSFGISLKIWGYKLLKFISFGLFNPKEAIEKAEMEKMILEHPEEALKKFGKDAVEIAKKQMPGKGEEKKESDEGKRLDTVKGPLGVLGGLATGIFAYLHLPKSITEKVNGQNGNEVLKFFKKRRMLKLFGFGGVTLLAASTLFAHFEEHPESLQELGKIPEDAEGRKSWWGKALDKAKIGVKDGKEKLVEILTGGINVVDGEALKKHYENKEINEGYVFLKDHPMLEKTKLEIINFEKDLEIMYHGNETLFKTLGVFSVLWKGGTIAGAGIKGSTLLLTLLKASAGTAIHHPLMMGLVVALAANSVQSVEHIQLPVDLTAEEIGEKLEDMLDLEDFQGYCEENFPDTMNKSYIAGAAQKLANNGEEMYEEIKDFKENWKTELPKKLLDTLIQTNQEKINTVNLNSIETFRTEVEKIAINAKKDEQSKYDTLIGPDKKSGTLGTIIAKLKGKNPILEQDIVSLMESSSGTNIVIFPSEQSKNGKTIQWAELDENGNNKGLAKNICVNPALELDEQIGVARDFVIDPHNPRALTAPSKAAEGLRDLVSQISSAMVHNPDQARNMVEKLLIQGGGILGFGAYGYAVDYLGNKYVLGPINAVKGLIAGIKGDGTGAQEALVEYGQGIAPVFLFSSIKNTGVNTLKLLSGKGWKGFGFSKIIAETLAYPITGPIDIGKYIFEKNNRGQLGLIFKDPAVLIRDQFYRYAGKIPGMPHSMKEIRELVHIKEDLFKIHEKLKKAQRMRAAGMPEHKIKELVKAAQDIYMEGSVGKYYGVRVEEFNAGNLDKLMEKTKNGINNCTDEINNIRGKGEKIARDHITTHPDSIQNTPSERKVSLDPNNPNHKKMMENFMEKSRGKLDAIEQERSNASKMFKEGKITQTDFDQKMKVWSQREGSIMRMQEHIHLKLHGKPLHGSKLGRFGRGLAGLVLTIGAVVAAQMAIEKWKTDDTSIEIPELDGEKSEENEGNFYGFKSETDKKKVDKSTENIPEDILPCLEKIESITAQYQLSFFSDSETIAKADDYTIEKNIRLIEETHEGLVIRMKSLLKEYKEPLKKYWANLKKQGEAINIKSENLGHLNAFISIKEKEDGLHLESMNKTDVSETLWGIVDGVKNGGIGQRILETGMGLLPITAEIQDAQFAYREFSRGHIADGFVHVGFFALDTVLDVAAAAAALVTAPAAGAGGAAVEAGAIGLRGALKQGAKWVAKKAIKGLKFEKIQGFVRTIGEAEKFQKYMTPWLSGIRGQALRLPSGDLVNSAIDIPRSDSINIDKL